MNWIRLPSGKYLNLDRAVAISFDGPRPESTYSNAYELRAWVTHSAGVNIDWPGREEYYDDDARFIQSYVSDIAAGGGAE